MRIREIVLTVALVLTVGFGVWFATSPGDDSAQASQRATWQVEMSVPNDELPAFLATLDASCDVDVEGMGLLYMVAYACSD